MRYAVKTILAALFLVISMSSFGKYTINGFPQLDALWKGKDYLTAANLLQKLPKDQLPSASNSEQAPYFNKLVDEGNLKYYGFQQIAIDERMIDVGDMISGTSIIFNLYAPSEPGQTARANDFVQVVGYMLALFNTTLDTAHTFLSAIGRGHPDYNARYNGFENMKIAMSHEVKGMLMFLSNRTLLSDLNRLELISKMLQSLPGMVRLFPANAKLEHKQLIASIIESEPNARVKAGLEELQKIF